MPDSAKPGFMQRQYEFAAHIRDPEHKQAPEDIEDRRMDIYRELFYNNVEGFLSSSFPVLRKLMDDASWHAMARDFYARHRSWKSPENFLITCNMNVSIRQTICRSCANLRIMNGWNWRYRLRTAMTGKIAFGTLIFQAQRVI